MSAVAVTAATALATASGVDRGVGANTVAVAPAARPDHRGSASDIARDASPAERKFAIVSSSLGEAV
jgi:hypothetical protein